MKDLVEVVKPDAREGWKTSLGPIPGPITDCDEIYLAVITRRPYSGIALESATA